MISPAREMVVVDHHSMIRTGLAERISEETELHLIGQYGTAQPAIDHIKASKPALIVCDHSIPEISGMELLEICKNVSPESNFMFYTSTASSKHIRQSLEAGAKGYVLKQSEVQDVITGSKYVSKGEIYLDRQVSNLLATEWAGGAQEDNPKLSRREVQILSMIVDGFTSKDIAMQLFVSVRTVDAHRRRIMGKLDARNMADLVRIAILNELYEPTGTV